jgi:tetratricopeptide (TPR) repeat protein
LQLKIVQDVEPQRLALQRGSAQWIADDIPVSEFQVSSRCSTEVEGLTHHVQILINFYHLKILVTAAEQGLLEETATKNNVAERLDVLRKWKISHGRLCEARFLTYFRLDLVGKNTEDLYLLQELLVALDGTENHAEGAQTHLDLARCLIRSGDPEMEHDAQKHITNAEQLFVGLGHSFGLIDLRNMEADERRNESLEASQKRVLDASQAYFAKECYQQGIRCLLFAISVSHNMGSTFLRTQDMLELVRRRAQEVGGVFLEQALFIHTVAQSLVRAPEFGYARKCLEDYLLNLPAEISPRTLSLIYTSLRGAYANMGNLDKAWLFADLALRSSVQGASYVDITDAAHLFAFTTFQTAQSYTSRRDMASILFANAINVAKCWTHIDEMMKAHEARQTKYLLLANIETVLGNLYSDASAFSRSDEWLSKAQECSANNRVPLKNAENLQLAREIRLKRFDSAVELVKARVEALNALKGTTNFALAQATMHVSTTLCMRYYHRVQTEAVLDGANIASIMEDLYGALKSAADALELYKVAAGSEMRIHAVNHICTLLHLLAPSSHRSQLFGGWLSEVDKAEAFCDAIRRSTASTQGLASFSEKRGIIAGKEYRELYSNAAEVCIKLENYDAAWLWVQKGKARALADVFGVRALIPETLL